MINFQIIDGGLKEHYPDARTDSLLTIRCPRRARARSAQLSCHSQSQTEKPLEK